MPTASRERAAAASAAKLAEQNETPIVTDNTDQETLNANNTGGPSVPGDMPDDIKTLFAGTVYDPNATITKATKAFNSAGKGKAKPLSERDANNLTECLTKITGPEGEEAGAEFGYVTWVMHEDFVNLKNRVNTWLRAKNITEIPVKASWVKHAVSPVGYDPKKTSENKGKKMVYNVLLTRGQTEDTDSVTDSE